VGLVAGECVLHLHRVILKVTVFEGKTSRTPSHEGANSASLGRITNQSMKLDYLKRRGKIVLWEKWPFGS